MTSPHVTRAVAGAACGVLAATVLAPLHARQLADVTALGVQAGGTGTALWIATGALPGAAIALLAPLGPTPPAVPMARGLPFKSRLHRARLAVRAAVEELVTQEDQA